MMQLLSNTSCGNCLVAFHVTSMGQHTRRTAICATVVFCTVRPCPNLKFSKHICRLAGFGTNKRRCEIRQGRGWLTTHSYCNRNITSTLPYQASVVLTSCHRYLLQNGVQGGTKSTKLSLQHGSGDVVPFVLQLLQLRWFNACCIPCGGLIHVAFPVLAYKYATAGTTTMQPICRQH